MKNKKTTTLHGEIEFNKSEAESKAVKGRVWKLGLDVDLRFIVVEHGHETLEAGWAGPRKWKRIGPQCSEFVRAELEPVVEQIRQCKGQLERLTREIEALVREEKIPVGLGALTMSLIEGRCAIGSALNIAKRWAVTRGVVRASTAVAACNASGRSTGTGTNMFGCCWWRRCGDSCAGSLGGTPGRSI
jgi:hypothetical protein